MTDGALNFVRVVGEEDIAFFDGAVVAFKKALDKGPELTDHHLAVAICN